MGTKKSLEVKWTQCLESHVCDVGLTVAGSMGRRKDTRNSILRTGPLGRVRGYSVA